MAGQDISLKETGKGLNQRNLVDELERVRVSGHDIDIEAVKAALETHEDWWSTLFDAAGLALAFGDLSGRIHAITPCWEEHFGYSLEEVQRIGVQGITHPEDFSKDLALFTELVEGKRDHYQIEKRYVRKDGTLIWGLLTVLLLRDSANEPRFAIAMVEDITQVKWARDLERRLDEARLRRLQALQLNDDLIQSLVVAKWALDTGDEPIARDGIESALRGAQSMLNDLIAEAGPSIQAGDLVRERPASSNGNS